MIRKQGPCVQLRNRYSISIRLRMYVRGTLEDGITKKKKKKICTMLRSSNKLQAFCLRRRDTNPEVATCES